MVFCHAPARENPLGALFLRAAVLLALFASHLAMAGPVRERLAERRAQAAASVPGEELATGDATPVGASIPGVAVLRDVSYGDHRRQRFDVYLPEVAVKGAPVLLMVHGGAWSTGDKAMRAVVENKVARWVPRGMIVVSTNYRLLPEAPPVEQAMDVARALAVAQERAAAWGGDRSRFVLMGHSAGAHLVSLLAASPAMIRQTGASPWRGTVALDSAGFDLVKIMAEKHYGFYNTAFGADPAYWRAASPVHQLGAPGAPFLAVCSSRRPDRPCLQAHGFADKARAIGMRVEVQEVVLSHREINEQLGQPSAYTEAVEAFMSSLGLLPGFRP